MNAIGPRIIIPSRVLTKTSDGEGNQESSRYVLFKNVFLFVKLLRKRAMLEGKWLTGLMHPTVLVIVCQK